MTIAPGNVQYTYAQIIGIWQQAGGNPQNGAMAAAIAMAESGGNSAAYGINSNGTIDRGLWQINSVHGSQSSFDVMTNARAAVAISNNGVSWRPWCTAYSDGACGTRGGTYLGQGAPYQRFMQSGTAVDLSAPINGTNAQSNQPNAQLASCSVTEWVISPGGCAIGQAAGGATEQIVGGAIKAVIGSILNPLIQIAAGVMGMTGGAILMVAGVFLIVRETQTYQSAKSGAEKGLGIASMFLGPEAEGAEAARAKNVSGHQSRASQYELNRRRQGAARAEAKQKSTQQLLQEEAARYGKVAAE